MRRRKELACIELVELVTAYFEGALTRRDRKRFEAHIAGCDACTSYLEQMRRTIAVMGRLPEESIPEPARAELLAAFRGWRES